MTRPKMIGELTKCGHPLKDLWSLTDQQLAELLAQVTEQAGDVAPAVGLETACVAAVADAVSAAVPGAEVFIMSGGGVRGWTGAAGDGDMLNPENWKERATAEPAATITPIDVGGRWVNMRRPPGVPLADLFTGFRKDVRDLEANLLRHWRDANWPAPLVYLCEPTEFSNHTWGYGILQAYNGGLPLPVWNLYADFCRHLSTVLPGLNYSDAGISHASADQARAALAASQRVPKGA